MANLPDNPKKAYGDKKPGLHLNPLSAQLAQWEAQFDGALKYGEVNWRDQPVEAMTYIDAAIRHIRLYENGEKYARDTNVQNLGAVMACCAILIDAELHGTLIDNRKHSPASCDLLHERGEEMVQAMRKSQAGRENPLVSSHSVVILADDAHPVTFGRGADGVPYNKQPMQQLPEDSYEVPATPFDRCDMRGRCQDGNCCNQSIDCAFRNQSIDCAFLNRTKQCDCVKGRRCADKLGCRELRHG